jgi:3'-phosphoadenosine 5'-phosphosulfate sulfotransferase (PAPS reductase)/FAD synthetase
LQEVIGFKIHLKKAEGSLSASKLIFQRLVMQLQLDFVIAPTPAVAFDINSYDRYLVAFSGGKDSIAIFLNLIEAGVDRSKIELHHHLVDGREGSNLFDWPITEDYCRQFAKAFGVPIYFSWLENGLEGEMLRQHSPKAATCFETESGDLMKVGGESNKLGTRRKFPAMVANLQTRWCSAYGKIDVMSALMRNQSRFSQGKTLVLTGERAEESSARAKYKDFEPHRTRNRSRHIDHWRPIHQWSEKAVWEIMQRHFGRLSCARCIFSSANQWATNLAIAPEPTLKMVEYEREFGHTIDAKLSILDKAAKGTVYPAIAQNHELVKMANSKAYLDPIFVNQWQMPSGAFGEANGSI